MKGKRFTEPPVEEPGIYDFRLFPVELRIEPCGRVEISPTGHGTGTSSCMTP